MSRYCSLFGARVIPSAFNVIQSSCTYRHFHIYKSQLSTRCPPAVGCITTLHDNVYRSLKVDFLSHSLLVSLSVIYFDDLYIYRYVGTNLVLTSLRIQQNGHVISTALLIAEIH